MDTDTNLNNIKKDENLLHDSGVDIVSSGVPASSVSSAKNDDTSATDSAQSVVDLSKDVTSDDEKSLEASGVKFLEPDVDSLSDVKIPNSIKDLEKDFLKESSTVPEPKKTEPEEIKIKNPNVTAEVEVLLGRLNQKIQEKKKLVQSQITNLRKVKGEIAEDIQEIKGLEETQVKLKAKKEAFQKLNAEIKEVEKEANEELSSF